MWQNSHGFQTMPEWSVTLLLLLLLYAYNICTYTQIVYSQRLWCAAPKTRSTVDLQLMLD